MSSFRAKISIYGNFPKRNKIRPNVVKFELALKNLTKCYEILPNVLLVLWFLRIAQVILPQLANYLTQIPFLHLLKLSSVLLVSDVVVAKVVLNMTPINGVSDTSYNRF